MLYFKLLLLQVTAAYWLPLQAFNVSCDCIQTRCVPVAARVQVCFLQLSQCHGQNKVPGVGRFLFMLSWGLLWGMMLQSNMSLSCQCQTDSGIGQRAAMTMSAVPPALCMGLYFWRRNWQELTVSSVHLQDNIKSLSAFLNLSLKKTFY